MAEEKVEPREINFRQLMPWTELFRGFQVALDPKKLLLAAAGIVVMWFGWWLLAMLFYDTRERPEARHFPIETYHERGLSDEEAQKQQANDLRAAEARWELLERTAGPGGELRTVPWAEDRGENPYRLVTGRAERIPWQSTTFVDWLLTEQLPVLVEPLVKFFRPVKYLLDARAGYLEQLYFILVILWTLATWSLFGGAITRMAAVQVARNERIGMMEALRFVWSRYLYYFTAPLFPLGLVAVIVFFMACFGLIGSIPYFGEVWDGLLWLLPLFGGVGMAMVLVGLVGWPLMYATISAEGSDSFDAISRSYSYVYQSPWNYIWYSVVALAYGAVVVFFVGFMGSLVVYLAKWGTSLWVVQSREISFLFVYAPESFHWRTLLLEGGSVTGADDLGGWQKFAAVLVSIWLYLFFLLILGFGYSYFWSASTIIYLLMRRKVDDTDLDEVYLEEEETEETYTPSTPPAPPAPSGPPGAVPLTMVEPPALKTASPPARTEAAANEGDGNADKPPPS